MTNSKTLIACIVLLAFFVTIASANFMVLPSTFQVASVDSDGAVARTAKNARFTRAKMFLDDADSVFNSTTWFYCDGQTDSLVLYEPIRPDTTLLHNQQCSVTYQPPTYIGYVPCGPKGFSTQSCASLFHSSQTGWPAKSGGMQCPAVDVNFNQTGDMWTASFHDSCGPDRLDIQMVSDNSSAAVLPVVYKSTNSFSAPFVGCETVVETTQYSQSLFTAPPAAEFDADVSHSCGGIKVADRPPMPLPSINARLVTFDRGTASAWLIDPAARFLPMCLFGGSRSDDFLFFTTVPQNQELVFTFAVGPCCNSNYHEFGTINLLDGSQSFERLSGSLDLQNIGIDQVGNAYAISGSGANPRSLLKLGRNAAGTANYTQLATYSAAEIGFPRAASYFTPSLFVYDNVMTLIGGGHMTKIDMPTLKVTSTVSNVPAIDRINFDPTRNAFFGVTSISIGSLVLAAIDVSTGKALPSYGAFMCDDDCDPSACSFEPIKGVLTCSFDDKLITIDVETLALTTAQEDKAGNMVYTTSSPEFSAPCHRHN